jgi:hypothetical protein
VIEGLAIKACGSSKVDTLSEGHFRDTYHPKNAAFIGPRNERFWTRAAELHCNTALRSNSLSFIDRYNTIT